MNKAIEFEGVSFSYEDETILQNVSFSLEKNDFVAVIGPNGGGKTTILKLMCGLLKPSKGKISILSNLPEKMLDKIGYVPQFSEFDKHFPISVEETVLMGRLHKFSFFPFYSEKDKMLAENAMKKTDILNLANKKISELSGGQKQRVLISRAIVNNPEILLLDEPLASVDSKVEADIYALLKELNKTTTIVLISHDVGVVSSFVNKIVCVNRNAVIHDSKAVANKELFSVYQSPVSVVHHQCGL